MGRRSRQREHVLERAARRGAARRGRSGLFGPAETTEKVSDGFYQLAGRRQNWDLTDYHPLLAQRAESAYGDLDAPDTMRPSIGYQQATEVREAADGDFLLIASDAGARGGAGTLAIFNRSVGPFEQGRDDPGYLRSLTIVDPAATGRVGAATAGAYRSSFDLPDGTIMASYAAYAGDLAAATSFDWDVVAIDPRTGARTTLLGGPGAQVDAVLALPMGIVEALFDAVCGGCHGSVSGSELDVAITPDALTGASRSASANTAPVDLTP